MCVRYRLTIRAMLRARTVLESSKDRDAAAQEIRTAVTAMHTSHATFAAEWSTQLTELTDDVRHSALAGADSHRQAEEVANELRRMRRLMREYAESL